MIDLTNQLVTHKRFGEGRVVTHDGEYLTITFEAGKKDFSFPNAFKGFICMKDETLMAQIERLIQREGEKQALQDIVRKKRLEELKTTIAAAKVKNRSASSKYPSNIAFKCNYCNGGQTEQSVGFCGVCSRDIIQNNIEVEKRTWCRQADGFCVQHLNGDLSREELDAVYDSKGFVCYESKMLRDWQAFAGIFRQGANTNKPMKLRNVTKDKLCILTTRDPQSSEDARYVFAVFLVDKVFEGDDHREGYVKAHAKYRMELTPMEARSVLFWNYHANKNGSEKTVWSSGLHRYFEDVPAAQMLRDIAKIKQGTDSEELAQAFYEHFCKINGIDNTKLDEPAGALRIRKA